MKDQALHLSIADERRVLREAEAALRDHDLAGTWQARLDSYRAAAAKEERAAARRLLWTLVVLGAVYGAAFAWLGHEMLEALRDAIARSAAEATIMGAM